MADLVIQLDDVVKLQVELEMRLYFVGTKCSAGDSCICHASDAALMSSLFLIYRISLLPTIHGYC